MSPKSTRAQVVRKGVRKGSGTALLPLSEACCISCFPAPACGCQGLSSLRSSAPGISRSEGAVGSQGSHTCQRVGRSTPRCTVKCQGYAPGTPANTRSRSVRTRPQRARQAVLPTTDWQTVQDFFPSWPLHRVPTTQGRVGTMMIEARRTHCGAFIRVPLFEYGHSSDPCALALRACVRHQTAPALSENRPFVAPLMVVRRDGYRALRGRCDSLLHDVTRMSRGSVAPDDAPLLSAHAEIFSGARASLRSARHRFFSHEFVLKQPHVDVTRASLSGQLAPSRRVGYFFPNFCMETATKKKRMSSAVETADPAAANAASGPLKVFRMDDVSASIFARERVVRGEPVTFHSVSFSRSYKDARGQWQYTKNFDSQDMGKVMLVAKQAGDFIDTRKPRSVAPAVD